jgi:predicted transcriptional regulator
MRQLVALNPPKKRSHLELITEILNNARTGRTKTPLMSKVGMSYRQFNHYLELLNRTGLLESNKGLYQTTPKGITFVKEYKTLLTVLLAEDYRIEPTHS